MGLFTSLFKKKEQETEKETIQSEKNFEVFKYDGMRAQRMGQIDFAIKCFEEALKIQEDFETMGYLSQLYIHTNELDKAHELLSKMIQADSQYISTYITLANLCFMQENYKEMAEVASKAIQIEEGNAMAYYLLGKAKHHDGDLLMGIGHLTKSIVLKEDFTDARLLRAQALIQLHNTKDALEDIEAVLAQDSENETALLMKGELAELSRNFQEAEEIYQKVIDLNPFSEKAFLAMGSLFINEKKYQEAIDLYTEAIEINNDFAKAYHERGRAKFLNGDKTGSMEDMKKAIELSPQEASKLNGTFNNQKMNENSANVFHL